MAPYVWMGPEILHFQPTEEQRCSPGDHTLHVRVLKRSALLPALLLLPFLSQPQGPELRSTSWVGPRVCQAVLAAWLGGNMATQPLEP